MKWCFLSLAFAIICATANVNCGITKRETTESLADEETRALEWYAKLNDEINLKKNKEAIASWAYASNITDENQKVQLDVSSELAKEYKVSSIFPLRSVPILIN